MSLNHDLTSSDKCHCALTSCLPITDEREFTTDNSNHIQSCVLKVYTFVDANGEEEGVPLNKCIVEDCNQVLVAVDTVYRHDGDIVLGLANCNGGKYSKR